MKALSFLKSLFNQDDRQRRFRYPALAEINKALFTLQDQIVEIDRIAHVLEHYKEMQEIPEPERDIALIPVYFELERFVTEHKPPIVKEEFSREQIREKIRLNARLPQMNEMFRLIFLPENQQADHVLKIGALSLLHFLQTSIGSSQLSALIKESVGDTPLGTIQVTDDGISFEGVHEQMAQIPVVDVKDMYRRLYATVYVEIEKLFGEKSAKELVLKSRKKLEETYMSTELVSIFLNALPIQARS